MVPLEHAINDANGQVQRHPYRDDSGEPLDHFSTLAEPDADNDAGTERRPYEFCIVHFCLPRYCFILRRPLELHTGVILHLFLQESLGPFTPPP